METLIKDWNLGDSLQQECYRNAVPKQYRMLFDASAVIIPLFKQKTDILHPDNLSALNGFASIWCSIEIFFFLQQQKGMVVICGYHSEMKQNMPELFLISRISILCLVSLE